MKKLILPILIFTIALIFTLADAAPTPIVTAIINNVTNTISPNILATPYTQPLQTASISHGILTSTNEMPVTVFATYNSTGTNGWVLLGTWYPSTTAAATETIPFNYFT